MIDNAYSGMCSAKNVRRIPAQVDKVMTTRSCPRLYKFLAYDEFDMKKVEEDIHRDIPEAYHYTKEVIEQIFETKVENLRQYFDLSDDLISVYGGPPNTKSVHHAVALFPITYHSQ